MFFVRFELFVVISSDPFGREVHEGRKGSANRIGRRIYALMYSTPGAGGVNPSLGQTDQSDHHRPDDEQVYIENRNAEYVPVQIEKRQDGKIEQDPAQ